MFVVGESIGRIGVGGFFVGEFFILLNVWSRIWGYDFWVCKFNWSLFYILRLLRKCDCLQIGELYLIVSKCVSEKGKNTFQKI